MNSREYATKLQKIVDFLCQKPAFEIPENGTGDVRLYYFFDKEPFLNAVRVVGSGKKTYETTGFLEFESAECPGLTLLVYRDAVCRKVQEEKWECEPWLTAEEAKVLG